MTKACPKCGHVRGENESAPDYQCPNCGVIYAKATAPRNVLRAPKRSGAGAITIVGALFLILAVGGVIGHGLYKEKVFGKQRKQLVGQIDKWHDALRLASSTARVGLAQPVARLQDIARDTKALPLTGCMDEARGVFVDSMQSMISGFLTFMQDQPSESAFEEAKATIDAASQKLQTCNAKNV